MALESGTYISDLVTTNPTAADPKSQGDDHIRLIKSSLKSTFPNVTGAVTPTHLQLNYVANVTSDIQAQLNTKAALASPALTGTPTAPTAVAGTNTDQIATTAFVTNQVLTANLPGQVGSAGKFLTTDGTTASWGSAQATLVSGANIKTLNGNSLLGSGDLVVGTGDVSGPGVSVDSELVLFSGTTGKAVKRSSASGLVKLSSGVVGTATANSDYLVPALTNTAVSGFKTATFNSQVANATTTGAVTINWANGQVQSQAAPTGAITYTFTAPPGVCHLQLLIAAPTTAQTITWPASVVWVGSTWSGVNGKAAVINFWYDGTNYYAMGANQV